MKKLTFERAVLIVFILIILISTSEISGKYIKVFFKKFDKSIVSTETKHSNGFSTMLMNADNLYNIGDYDNAVKAYFAITLNNTLSPEQKIHANFRLGMCQFNLNNYELAHDRFMKVISFNPNDSVAYNNAAVCAYKAGNLNGAIELQKKALETMPAVEYYYNLARMHEDNEEYELAASNYLVVSKGEHNITKTERIDPVRVKEKVARLRSKFEESMSEAVSNVLIALRLRDIREILTINDNEMHLKDTDFVVKVKAQKETKSIFAEYDRLKNDPYDLISDISWTVYKASRPVFNGNGAKISYVIKDSGDYEVRLNIKYSGKELTATKIVRITENQSMIDNTSQDEVLIKTPADHNERAYIFSVYEQLFESDFQISSYGFTDKYNVIWGKDGGIETSHNKALAVDRTSSLIVNNTSSRDGGLWISLDSLLEMENIKGRTVSVSFFARGITDDVKLDVNVRVKAKGMISTTPVEFALPFQFKQKLIEIYIPEDANSLTVSIKAKPGDEFNIDGFTIVN